MKLNFEKILALLAIVLFSTNVYINVKDHQEKKANNAKIRQLQHELDSIRSVKREDAFPFYHCS